jgi:hypothetical protein
MKIGIMVMCLVLSVLPVAAQTCDPTLWQHVYHGKRFHTAKDRLRPVISCMTVTGILHFVRYEADGDAHLRLDVDAKFKTLLNAKNLLEKNMLVIEDECDKAPTQADAIQEGVCKGFRQGAYDSSMNGKHVAVTGVYVEDQEHGWRELHPISSIVVTH